MLDVIDMLTQGHLDMLNMLDTLDTLTQDHLGVDMPDILGMLTQDHLDMLDSPERVVPDRIEQIGHTLEFLPEDNTVIR